MGVGTPVASVADPDYFCLRYPDPALLLTLLAEKSDISLTEKIGVSTPAAGVAGLTKLGIWIQSFFPSICIWIFTLNLISTLTLNLD